PTKNLSEDMLFMGIEGEPRRKATVRKVAVYESDPNWRQNRPDPHQFGNLPGHEVGSWWPTRMACCHSGVHAPTVAGIAWNEGEGATSIALSG
ncbi:29636_t:CDS:2, partial [Racocetra persica]